MRHALLAAQASDFALSELMVWEGALADEDLFAAAAFVHEKLLSG